MAKCCSLLKGLNFSFFFTLPGFGDYFLQLYQLYNNKIMAHLQFHVPFLFLL